MSLIGWGCSYELNLLTIGSLEQTWLEVSGKRQGVFWAALIDWGNFELLFCWYPTIGLLTL